MNDGKESNRFSVIRQLIAGLAFCGLLLFGAPTLSGVIEYVDAWRKGSRCEIAGFVAFGVMPTAVFATVLILAMHGHWSHLFRQKENKGKANHASDATSEPAPGADSSAHQG